MSDEENKTPEEDKKADAPEGDVALEEFAEGDAAKSGAGEACTDEGVSAIHDVPVQVSAVLGQTSMQVNQLLKLSRGAVIELDRKVGEAIDIYVNNRLVARGEVVVVNDQLGITMTEIIKSDSAA